MNFVGFHGSGLQNYIVKTQEILIHRMVYCFDAIFSRTKIRKLSGASIEEIAQGLSPKLPFLIISPSGPAYHY